MADTSPTLPQGEGVVTIASNFLPLRQGEYHEVGRGYDNLDSTKHPLNQ